VEVGFELQVSCLPVLGMFDALLRSAGAGVLEHQRDDAVEDSCFSCRAFW
jgi:hypothetical protein